MKINEVAIKRLAEEEPSTGLGPTRYGAQDEGLGMAFANAVATGTAAVILKKILERVELKPLIPVSGKLSKNKL